MVLNFLERLLNFYLSFYSIKVSNINRPISTLSSLIILKFHQFDYFGNFILKKKFGTELKNLLAPLWLSVGGCLFMFTFTVKQEQCKRT